jgi:DNA polymerase-4
MARAIVHMDLDTFLCLVNDWTTLNWKNSVIGGGDRGVVASCIWSGRFGSTFSNAYRDGTKLCPQAKVSKVIWSATHSIHTVIQKITYYRKASIDEFYLDITGMDRFMVV